MSRSNLDFPVLQTLASIYHVKDNLPALLIGEEVYYGFKNFNDIKEIIPELKEIDSLKESLEEDSATSTEN